MRSRRQAGRASELADAVNRTGTPWANVLETMLTKMAQLEAIREKLNRAQAMFCQAVDEMPAEKWAVQPGPEQWSAAEVVAHLVAVEQRVVAKADSIMQKTPLPTPRLKRMHLPMWFVRARLVRRKSPVPPEASLMAEKGVMLGMLHGARERTFAFLSDTQHRDLSPYYWKHPFIGMLNAYDWMVMIAAHQVRHAKQIREIHEKVSRK